MGISELGLSGGGDLNALRFSRRLRSRLVQRPEDEYQKLERLCIDGPPDRVRDRLLAQPRRRVLGIDVQDCLAGGSLHKSKIQW